MKNIKLPSNELILYALALAGALNFMYALTALDGASLLTVPGFLSLLRGLVTGAVSGLAMAKIAHALPRANKTNHPYIMAAFVAFLLVTIPIISVVTYAKMSGVVMSALPLEIRVIVAIATGVLIDALTAGVAFASGKLEADDKPIEAKQSEPKAAKVAEIIAPLFVCPVCKRNCASQNALNAHSRKHKAVIEGYVATFEPVIKDGTK
jgi:hypothetical protein